MSAAHYELPAGIDPEKLAPDSMGVPATPVSAAASRLSREDPRLWLPTGYISSLGMHIEHDHRVQTGPFVGPRHPGIGWHITVSPWKSVDEMREVLHEKHAEVPFVIGARDGEEKPVIIQCLPVNEYGKGFIHEEGTPETNRANEKTQIEVCADEETIQNFTHYRALANLAWLLMHGHHPRLPAPNRLARSFQNTKRFTQAGFPRVEGHFGHMHAPIPNDHEDPTVKFKGRTLVRLIDTAPHQL